MKLPALTARAWMYGVLAAAALSLGWLVVFDKDAGLLRVDDLRRQHEALTAEARDLGLQRDHLVRRLDQVRRGDPYIIETVARDKNMIRPGDQVYRIHFQPVWPESGAAELP